MDNILDFDAQEIKSIKKALKEKDEAGTPLHSVFIEYAPKLFESCFQMLLSSGAKTENIIILKEMAESEDDALQVKIDQLLDITLNICSSIIKSNLKGTVEFQLILNDLGMPAENQATVSKIFEKEYLNRLEQLNNVYEDNGENSTINQKFSKKHPLNMSLADEALIVSNPRLVDVDWQLIHTLSSKNLNKIFQPRFQITLTMLQQGDALQTGATSLIEWSSKRNSL